MGLRAPGRGTPAGTGERLRAQAQSLSLAQEPEPALGRAAHLRREHAETAETYRIKLAFQELYEQLSEHADLYLADWVEMGVTCGLQPIEDFACSVAEHWDGVCSGQVLGCSTGSASPSELDCRPLCLVAVSSRIRPDPGCVIRL
jgi:Transposase